MVEDPPSDCTSGDLQGLALSTDSSWCTSPCKGIYFPSWKIGVRRAFREKLVRTPALEEKELVEKTDTCPFIHPCIYPSIHPSTTQCGERSDSGAGKISVLFCFHFVLFLFSPSTEELATNTARVGTLHRGRENEVASLGGAGHWQFRDKWISIVGPGNSMCKDTED